MEKEKFMLGTEEVEKRPFPDEGDMDFINKSVDCIKQYLFIYDKDGKKMNTEISVEKIPYERVINVDKKERNGNTYRIVATTRIQYKNIIRITVKTPSKSLSMIKREAIVNIAPGYSKLSKKGQGYRQYHYTFFFNDVTVDSLEFNDEIKKLGYNKTHPMNNAETGILCLEEMLNCDGYRSPKDAIEKIGNNILKFPELFDLFADRLKDKYKNQNDYIPSYENMIKNTIKKLNKHSNKKVTHKLIEGFM